MPKSKNIQSKTNKRHLVTEDERKQLSLLQDYSQKYTTGVSALVENSIYENAFESSEIFKRFLQLGFTTLEIYDLVNYICNLVRKCSTFGAVRRKWITDRDCTPEFADMSIKLVQVFMLCESEQQKPILDYFIFEHAMELYQYLLSVKDYANAGRVITSILNSKTLERLTKNMNLSDVEEVVGEWGQ